MAETAAEILQRMREQRRKGPAKIAVDPEDFYVKLRILPQRRRQLVFYTTLAFFCVLALVMRDMHTERPWALTALPIVFIGLMITLVPATEEWLYRPWQAKPRQYERHQIER